MLPFGSTARVDEMVIDRPAGDWAGTKVER